MLTTAWAPGPPTTLIDPKRPEQPKVNDWNAAASDNLIWYATRSTITYYDNDLADVLIEEEFPTWIETGKALGTVDDPAPEPDNKPDPDHGSSDSGSSSSYTTAADPNSGTWTQDEYGWRFTLKNGTQPKAQWFYLDWNGTKSWYYFSEEGYMITGWFEHEGNRYYLHPISDGTMGHMYVGWHFIDGKWYYFNQQSDGTMGRLLINTTTPDGYVVGADGTWVQ